MSAPNTSALPPSSPDAGRGRATQADVIHALRTYLTGIEGKDRDKEAFLNEMRAVLTDTLKGSGFNGDAAAHVSLLVEDAENNPSRLLRQLTDEGLRRMAASYLPGWASPEAAPAAPAGPASAGVRQRDEMGKGHRRKPKKPVREQAAAAGAEKPATAAPTTEAQAMAFRIAADAADQIERLGSDPKKSGAVDGLKARIRGVLDNLPSSERAKYEAIAGPAPVRKPAGHAYGSREDIVAAKKSLAPQRNPHAEPVKTVRVDSVTRPPEKPGEGSAATALRKHRDAWQKVAGAALCHRRAVELLAEIEADAAKSDRDVLAIERKILSLAELLPNEAPEDGLWRDAQGRRLPQQQTPAAKFTSLKKRAPELAAALQGLKSGRALTDTHRQEFLGIVAGNLRNSLLAWVRHFRTYQQRLAAEGGMDDYTEKLGEDLAAARDELMTAVENAVKSKKWPAPDELMTLVSAVADMAQMQRRANEARKELAEGRKAGKSGRAGEWRSMRDEKEGLRGRRPQRRERGAYADREADLNFAIAGMGIRADRLDRLLTTKYREIEKTVTALIEGAKPFLKSVSLVEKVIEAVRAASEAKSKLEKEGKPVPQPTLALAGLAPQADKYEGFSQEDRDGYYEALGEWLDLQEELEGAERRVAVEHARKARHVIVRHEGIEYKISTLAVRKEKDSVVLVMAALNEEKDQGLEGRFSPDAQLPEGLSAALRLAQGDPEDVQRFISERRQAENARQKAAALERDKAFAGITYSGLPVQDLRFFHGNVKKPRGDRGVQLVVYYGKPVSAGGNGKWALKTFRPGDPLPAGLTSEILGRYARDALKYFNTWNRATENSGGTHYMPAETGYAPAETRAAGTPKKKRSAMEPDEREIVEDGRVTGTIRFVPKGHGRRLEKIVVEMKDGQSRTYSLKDTLPDNVSDMLAATDYRGRNALEAWRMTARKDAGDKLRRDKDAERRKNMGEYHQH